MATNIRSSNARPAATLALLAALGLSEVLTGQTARTGSLGVSVSDKDGQAVRDARVELLHSANGTPGTPVVTDAAGRAVLVGLAEGEWSVVVTHPDFMTFNAYVEVRPGKVARQTFAAQVATPASYSPMRVSYFVPKGPPTPPATAVQKVPAKASPPPPPPQVPADSRPPVAPAPPPPQPPVVVPVPEAPPGRVPAPPEVPADSTPPAPAVPAVPPAPAPKVPADSTPSVEPPSVVPPSEVPPVAPVAPPPSVLPKVPAESADSKRPTTQVPALRTAQNGGCPECRGTEVALSVEGEVAAVGIAGQACAAASTEASSWIQAQLQAVPGPISLVSAAGECRAFAIALPEGAKFRGYRFEAEDDRQSGDCLAGSDCAIGEARWTDHPQRIPRTGLGELLIARFENRAATARRVRFTVYLAPAGPR